MNELAIVADLAIDLPGHGAMLARLNEALPAIERDSRVLGGKRQTQFMDRVLTTSHHTPERNLRQVLAELDRTLDALRSNGFKLRKQRIRAALKREQAATLDGLRYDLAIVQAEEIESGIAASERFVAGAVRKAAALVEQRDSLMAALGVEQLTEEALEASEERHHIKTSFAQAMNAARSNGGRIDEGNAIYLSQLGINVGVAQQLLSGYLAWELKEIAEGREPTAADVRSFLDQMAQRFAGCAREATEARGLTGGAVKAALTTEDERWN